MLLDLYLQKIRFHIREQTRDKNQTADMGSCSKFEFDSFRENLNELY